MGFIRNYHGIVTESIDSYMYKTEYRDIVQHILGSFDEDFYAID